MNRAQLRRQTEISYTKNGEQICRYKKRFQLVWKDNHIENLETIHKYIRLYTHPLPTHAKSRLNNFGKETKITDELLINPDKTKEKPKKLNKRLLQQTQINHENHEQTAKRSEKHTTPQKHITRQAPIPPNQIEFRDPDEELYKQWQEETEKTVQRLYPDGTYPYSHPDDNNLQITPYKGPRRMESRRQLFQDPEPTTTAQKRREEIALGKY